MATDANSTFAQAQVLVDLGRCDEAVSLLIPAVAADQGDARLRLQLAMVLLRLDRLDAAQEAVSEALVRDPHSEWGFRILRRCPRRGSQRSDRANADRGLAEALRAARRAVELAPRGWAAFETLASVEAACGNLVAARLAAERAVQLSPRTSSPRTMLTVVELKSGDYIAAEAAARSALEIAPTSYEALNNLGLALQGQGRLQEAAEAMARAASINAKHSSAPRNLQLLARQTIIATTLAVAVALGVLVGALPALAVLAIAAVGYLYLPERRGQIEVAVGKAMGRRRSRLVRSLARLLAIGAALAVGIAAGQIGGVLFVMLLSVGVYEFWIRSNADVRRSARAKSFALAAVSVWGLSLLFAMATSTDQQSPLLAVCSVVCAAGAYALVRAARHHSHDSRSPQPK